MSNKKNNAHNLAQKAAAEKAAAEKAAEKEAAEKAAAEKVAEESKWIPKKVKMTLGFSKRNYNVGGKLVLLEAGKEISEENYILFDANVRKKFFENI